MGIRVKLIIIPSLFQTRSGASFCFVNASGFVLVLRLDASNVSFLLHLDAVVLLRFKRV